MFPLFYKLRRNVFHTVAHPLRIPTYLSSQQFLQTYSSNLPTSLTNFLPLDEVLLTLKTWGGFWYDHRTCPVQIVFRKTQRQVLQINRICIFPNFTPFLRLTRPCGSEPLLVLFCLLKRTENSSTCVVLWTFAHLCCHFPFCGAGIWTCFVFGIRVRLLRTLFFASSLSLNFALPTANCSSSGTLLFFRHETSLLINCYYNQDLLNIRIHIHSRDMLPLHILVCLLEKIYSIFSKEYRRTAQRLPFSAQLNSTRKLLHTS